MAAKTHFDKQETAERNDARSENKRIRNYRFDPFQDNEVVEQRPNNCYGCTWEPITSGSNKGKYRLKFKHRLCYPAHARYEAVP